MESTFVLLEKILGSKNVLEFSSNTLTQIANEMAFAMMSFELLEIFIVNIF